LKGAILIYVALRYHSSYLRGKFFKT
jgi:hypothetical protein